MRFKVWSSKVWGFRFFRVVRKLTSIFESSVMRTMRCIVLLIIPKPRINATKTQYSYQGSSAAFGWELALSVGQTGAGAAADD